MAHALFGVAFMVDGEFSYGAISMHLSCAIYSHTTSMCRTYKKVCKIIAIPVTGPHATFV